MHTFLKLSFAAVLALLPYAATAGEECVKSSICPAYNKAGPERLKPPVPEMVCVHFVQSGTDKVVLGLYDVYNPDNINDPSNRTVRQLSKIAGPSGKFCLGKQWFYNHGVTWVMICNGSNYYDIRLEAFQDEIVAGSLNTCLLGVAGCAALM